MITIKKHVTTNGMPGWRVYAGDNCLGTIFHPDTMDWQGVAPDGKRFVATSQRKLIEKMRLRAIGKLEEAHA